MLTHTCIHIEREKERHCSSVNKDEDICSRASRERKRERGTHKYIKSHISDVGKEGNKRGRNKLEIDVHVHGGREGKMTMMPGFRRGFTR